MRKVILVLLLLLGIFNVFAQTIIAKQSFESSGDTWTPLSFSTPPCSISGDIWNYQTNLQGLTPSEGNQFWGIRDLNGSCGGNGFETISFPNVDVSGFSNVIFSFDYFAFSFDNNDDLKYELFFDNISQGEVVVVDGNNSNGDNTNGWITESVSIPTSVNSVRLILSARNNHGSDIGGFDNVLLLSSPLSNGGCTTSIPLTVGETNTENIVSGTNIGATNSGELPLPSCGNYNSGRDVWYTAQVPQGGNITLETLSSQIDPVIAVYTGACGNLTQIACNDDVNYPSSLESKLELTGLANNTTLYIRVYAYNNASSGNFNIVAYSPPTTSNDNCFTAQELIVGNSNTENVVTSTNEGATNSGVSLNPNCDAYQGGDVWFTTTVPASGILTIETLDAGGIDDTGLAIYTGDCNNLTQIACDADSGAGFFSLIHLENLPNTTIYIRVWEYQNNSFGAFNIVAYSPQCAFTTRWNGNRWVQGAPNAFTSAVIDNDYTTATNGSFESCNCTISSRANLTISGNTFVSVENNLVVDGSLDILHEGSLLMTNDSGIVSGTGNSQVYKTSTPYNLNDYLFWSSPVTNASIGNVFATSDPQYMYRYNYQSGWVNIGTSTSMENGTGYIIEGDTSGTFPRTQSIIFNGSVNNGIITSAVGTTGVEGFDWNLIGNPYPSAIDATLFLNNNTNLNGSIYLWTHNTQISSNNTGANAYNYSSDDYASFTAGTGGVAAVSGGTVPNGFIASGQGFFVQANTTGTIVFNNSMRVSGNNDQLFRQEKDQITEKDRIWLDLKNDKGAFSQILVGYFAKATDGIDSYFDGKKFLSNNFVSFYSLVENQPFVIQGKTAINHEDSVPLGFTSNIELGDVLAIGISSVEGKLNEYNVYLKDHLLGTTHDLKMSDYAFVMDQKGTFNNRFELYLSKSGVLSIDDEVSNSEQLIITNTDANITVKSRNGSIISNIKAYDILGRLIIEANPKNSIATIYSEQLKQGAVILLNTTLESGRKINKKLLIQ